MEVIGEKRVLHDYKVSEFVTKMYTQKDSGNIE